MASSAAPKSDCSSRAGRVKGIKNLSEDELELLLDLADKHLSNSRRLWATLQRGLQADSAREGLGLQDIK
jgi:hypothetical protein